MYWFFKPELYFPVSIYNFVVLKSSFIDSFFIIINQFIVETTRIGLKFFHMEKESINSTTQ